jgi:hypothetical protein
LRAAAFFAPGARSRASVIEERGVALKMASIVVNDGFTKRSFALAKDKIFSVGRSRDNSVSFPENPKISRRHCEIYYYPKETCFVLKDLGSLNGTILNDAKISSPVALSDNDTVTVANVSMVFSEGRKHGEGRAKVARPVALFGSADSDMDLTQQTIVDTDDSLSGTFADGTAPDLPQGEKISGYEIVRKLGTGDYSAVYLVKRTQDGAPRALKLFSKSFIGNQRAVNDFMGLACKISGWKAGDAVLACSDAGAYNSRCYYTMDFLPSATLKTRIARNAPFNELASLKTVLAVASALKTSWTGLRVAHKDLKPSNILYSSKDEPVISDMGFAEWRAKYITEGTSAASPLYISPEQITGDFPVSWQSDLYALGLIFFQMLTGVLPFFSMNDEELCAMHAEEKMPKPRDRNPNIRVSDSSADMILRMTAKKPADRFASWDELTASIAALLAGTEDTADEEAPVKPDKTAHKDLGDQKQRKGLKKKKLFFSDLF